MAKKISSISTRFVLTINDFMHAYRRFHDSIEKPEIILANRNQAAELRANNETRLHSQQIAELDDKYHQWEKDYPAALWHYYCDALRAVADVEEWPEPPLPSGVTRIMRTKAAR